MSDLPNDIREVLALSDEQFFAADATLLAERRRLAGRSSFVGLALACPPRLKDSRLPLLLVSKAKSGRMLSIKPGENQLVVVASIGRGPVCCGPMLPPQDGGKKPAPEKAPTPQPEAQQATL